MKMHNEYESPAQLKEDRDYWKHRYMEYRKDVEFFVLITLAGIMFIVGELIINRFWRVPIE